jgi:transposase
MSEHRSPQPSSRATSSSGTISTSAKAGEPPQLPRKAWGLFLPRYSPDLNPIDMAFSKRKTLLRKKKARTYDDLWKSIGAVCEIFSQQECRSYFTKAGCAT